MITRDGDNPDYITLLDCFDRPLRLVVIMHHNHSDDSYIQTKCSIAMKPQAAQALAESWSKATGLEIR